MLFFSPNGMVFRVVDRVFSGFAGHVVVHMPSNRVYIRPEGGLTGFFRSCTAMLAF